MVIAVDFDGTLVNGKDAIEGAREAVNIMREQGHKIMIYSCNRVQWIQRVLQENDIRYDYIYEGNKPVCDLYIDDRNVEFNGNWEETLAKVSKAKSHIDTLLNPVK